MRRKKISTFFFCEFVHVLYVCVCALKGHSCHVLYQLINKEGTVNLILIVGDKMFIRQAQEYPHRDSLVIVCGRRKAKQISSMFQTMRTNELVTVLFLEIHIDSY